MARAASRIGSVIRAARTFHSARRRNAACRMNYGQSSDRSLHRSGMWPSSPGRGVMKVRRSGADFSEMPHRGREGTPAGQPCT